MLCCVALILFTIAGHLCLTLDLVVTYTAPPDSSTILQFQFECEYPSELITIGVPRLLPVSRRWWVTGCSGSTGASTSGSCMSLPGSLQGG